MAVVGGEVFIDILPNMVGFDAALEEGLREHTDAVVADNPGMFDGLATGVELAERDVTGSLARIGLATEGVGGTFARVGEEAAAGWQVSMGALGGVSGDVAGRLVRDADGVATGWVTSSGVVTGESRKIVGSLEQTGTEAEKTGSIFDRISSTIGSGFLRAANTMQLAGIPLGGELDKIGNKFKEAETDGTGFTATMTAVGGLTVAAAAVAGAAFIDMGSKFQTSTTQMAASGNIPIKLADQIGNAFLHSGSDVVYSAKDQEQAFGAVAGQMAAVQGHVLTVTQTTEFMSHAMDLAEESGVSLKSATADLSGEMQAFQIPLSGVTSASTDLFNASRITGVGIDSLSSTLDRMKARLGVAAPDLADLSSMLVDLAEHGVTGSRGLMVVNTAMTTLLKSSATLQTAQEKANATFGAKEAADRLAVANAQSALSLAEGVGHASTSTLAADQLKLSNAQTALTAYVKEGTPALTGNALAIQQLGLQVYNSHGQFVGMSAIIGELQPKLEHMTQQQQLAALGSVFGASANKALLDTVLAGPGAYDKANKAVTDAAAAHQALVVQQQTLGHELESVKVLVENFATEIGLRLLPFVHDALTGAADFIGYLEGHKAIFEVLGALVGTVLVGAVGLFISSMAGMAGGAVMDAIKGLVLGFQELTGAELEADAAADANPFGLIVLAVAALTAVVVELATHWTQVWGAIKTVFDDTVKFLRSGIGTLLLALSGPVGALVILALHWQQVWGAMRGPVMAVVNFMEGIGGALSGPVLAIVGVFASLPGEIAGIAEAIPSFFERLPGEIVSFFVGLPGRILDELKALPDQLLDLALNLLITWPIMLAREAITAGVAIVRGLVSGLTEAVPAVFDWFVGLPRRILSLSLNVGSIGIGMIGDIVDGLVDGAVGLWHFFTDLPGDIAGIFSGGGGKTKGAPSGGAGKAALHNAGGSIIDSILAGLGDAAEGIFTWFLELPGRILDHIAAGTGDQFNRAGAAFVRAILDGMAGAAGDVGDFFANVWGDVASTTAAVWDPVVAVIVDVWNVIYTVIHAVWTGISDFLTVQWTIVSTTARVLWAIVYYVIIEVWQLIDEGIRAVWGATSGWVVARWDAFADVARDAWTAVYAAVVGVWDRLTAGIEDVWSTVSAWLVTAWDAFADVASAAWQPISTVIIDIWDLISAGVEVIWDALRDFLKSEWSTFLAVATTLWTPISQVITAIWSAMDSLIRAIWDALRDFLRAEWTTFATVATTAWDAVSGAVDVAWNTLDRDVRGIWGALKTFLGSEWAAFAKTATLAWDGIVGGIGSAWGALTGIAADIWGGVKSAFTSGANDVIKVLNDFIGLLRDIPGVKNAGLKLIPLIGGGGGATPTSGGLPASAAGIPGLAAGGTWGVYDTPTVLVAEGNRAHPEVVIPTDPAYRANAMGLIGAAMRMMSYTGGPGRAGAVHAYAAGGVIDAASFLMPALDSGGIVGNLTGAIGAVTGGVGSAVGDVGKAAGAATSGISGALSSIASAFTGMASEAAGWVLGTISKAMITPVENLAISGMERLPQPISGIGVTVVKAIADFITSQKPAAGTGGATVPYSGSGGVAQWTPIATAVADALGQAGSVGAILRRIQFESGGNPTAVNKYDINWQEGHPSVGLAQVIRGTFQEFAGQYVNTGPFAYGVSEDPMANVYAGMNYATHVYGSIAAIDPAVRPVGYDQGGILPPGLTMAFNNTGVNERIISPSGAGGGGVTIAAGAVQVEVVIGDGNSDMGTVRTVVQSAVTDAIEQVMQIAGASGAFGGSR